MSQPNYQDTLKVCPNQTIRTLSAYVSQPNSLLRTLSCLLFHFALRAARFRDAVFLVSVPSSSPLLSPPPLPSVRFGELLWGLSIEEVGVVEAEVGVAVVEMGVAKVAEVEEGRA